MRDIECTYLPCTPPRDTAAEKFYNFGVDYPTLLVAAYTFIASLLNGVSFVISRFLSHTLPSSYKSSLLSHRHAARNFRSYAKLLLWCFSCAVLSYARYRLSLGRPISLRGLSALSSAKDGQLTFNNPITSKWAWLLLFCWACFLTTTTGFNTILLRKSRFHSGLKCFAVLIAILGFLVDVPVQIS